MERVQIVPKSYPDNLIKKDWTQRKCYYRKNGIQFMEKVHEMQVREDDVWLVTLPKCGTTWMQELLWLIINDYNFDEAKREHLEVRSPFLEFDFLLNENAETSLDTVKSLKPPRLIKSHLPLPLLPAQLWSKKPKLVYVYRDPKDALVSEYYHARSVGYDMDKSCEQSLSDYIDHSSLTHLPFEHVLEFYELRHEPWVFYTSYERMKSNLRQIIIELVDLLNKTINDEQIKALLEHLSFESMKDNPKTNHIWEFEEIRKRDPDRPYEKHNFVRKGQVGTYKEELSPHFIVKCNRWIEDQLKPHNVTLEELLLTSDIAKERKNMEEYEKE